MRVSGRDRVVTLSALLVIAWSTAAGSAQQAAQTPAQRGKYLVTVMDCHGCHTPFKMGQPDMTRMLIGHPQDVKIVAAPALPPGGVWGTIVNETNTAWAGPWGVSFTANLTPDRATGLGSWTEDMFVTSIRKGRHMGNTAAGGREILPPMPWESYSALTDADLKAIFAYLKTIPAVANRVPAPIRPAGARN
jgi:cytochrome c